MGAPDLFLEKWYLLPTLKLRHASSNEYQVATALTTVAVGTAVTCRPPAQIRTCGTTAYGSCLGYVTRSDPQGKDGHSQDSVYRGQQGGQNVSIEADDADCDA